MQSQRINWVDSAKGLGILCVIMGHTAMTPDIIRLIYTFHMPLFFLLSGIFLLRKERSLGEELKRKALSLLVPYGVFNLLMLFIYDVAVPLCNGASIKTAHILTTLQGICVADRIHSWHWFLPCLFGAEVLLILYSRLHKNLLPAGVLFMVLGSLFNYYVGKPLPMSLDNVFIASSFIVGGIWLRDHEWETNGWTTLLLISSYLLFASLSIDSTLGRGINMYASRYGNYLYFYVMAASAILLILQFIRRFPDSRVLCFLGRNSLLIYCTHTLFLDLSRLVIKQIPVCADYKNLQSIVLSLAATAFVCLASVPLSWLVNRYAPWMLGRLARH